MEADQTEHPLGPEERASEQFAQRVKSVQDLEPRFTYVRHTLGRMTPSTVAGILAIAAGRAELRHAPHPQLLLAMTVALVTAPDLRQRVLQAAIERGLFHVVDFLGAARGPAGGSQPPTSAPARQSKPPRTTTQSHTGKSRPLTLGERKALARTQDRNRIAQALRDPHPAVVARVLKNPFVREEDVLRVCAARPLFHEVLIEILQCPKWVVRYRILRAIVLNPHTPPEIAVPLSAHLTGPDAQVVATSPSLDVSLREACMRYKRGPTQSEMIH